MVQATAKPDAPSHSWDFLNGFTKVAKPAQRQWDFIEAMQSAAPLDAYKLRYRDLVEQWDARLEFLGGDASGMNWENFRPLRPGREEDWSDWLAWLLESSAQGEFAAQLFGTALAQPAPSFANPKVQREASTADHERRGDIVILLPSIGIHLEVKVGDEQFEKTFETGQKLESDFKSARAIWGNFILMPKSSLADWNDQLEGTQHSATEVNVLLWEDVVRALRWMLWQKKESLRWQTWAWTFCGVIENKVLGLAKPDVSKSGISQYNTLIRWVELLKLETS